MIMREEFIQRARVAMIAAVSLVATAAATQAADAVKAPDFVKGIWATEDGCKKQAAIDAGGPKSVETTPETLTPDGYKGWEGGCTFTSVTENGPGKWTVKTDCHEAVEEWQDTEQWELDSTGTRLIVMVEDQVTEFLRCDAGKEAKQ